LQEKGFGEKRVHPRRIEPRAGAGCSDEGDGPAHAELAIQFAELSRESRQGIEDMRQAHAEVVAPHGIPVEGKGMLVVVALVLCAPCIGAVFQRVRIPPGNFCSGRQQLEQSWR